MTGGSRECVVVFFDGDFWHSRDLDARIAKLERGHNAPYWVAKIRRNVERDRGHDAALSEAGWTVLRYWESDIRADADGVASPVKEAVDQSGRSPTR